jgi:hypothetical protein
MSKEKKTSTTGKNEKSKETRIQEERLSPAFKQFKKESESLNKHINLMAMATFNRLLPGPLWVLNTSELEKSKAILEEQIKHIEDIIIRARNLTDTLKDEEHIMIMDAEKIKRLELLKYSDFTCEPYFENYIITRRKYTEQGHQ